MAMTNLSPVRKVKVGDKVGDKAGNEARDENMASRGGRATTTLRQTRTPGPRWRRRQAWSLAVRGFLEHRMWRNETPRCCLPLTRGEPLTSFSRMTTDISPAGT